MIAYRVQPSVVAYYQVRRFQIIVREADASELRFQRVEHRSEAAAVVSRCLRVERLALGQPLQDYVAVARATEFVLERHFGVEQPVFAQKIAPDIPQFLCRPLDRCRGGTRERRANQMTAAVQIHLRFGEPCCARYGGFAVAAHGNNPAQRAEMVGGTLQRLLENAYGRYRLHPLS